MNFQQDELDEFLTTIRCDFKLTLDEFKKLMVNVCVEELNLSPTNLFNNLDVIGYQASPTEVGYLILEMDEKEIMFEVKYNEEKITNVKLVK